MGCCQSTRSNSKSFLFSKKLQEAIERGKLANITNIYRIFCNDSKNPSAIDDPFTTLHGLNLSPLAYALWAGRLSSFLHIQHKLGASLSAMESLLEGQGKSAINLLCINGNLEILEHYLPIYLNKLPSESEFPNDLSLSVDFQKSTLVETKLLPTFMPIHIAVENGHLQVIDFFHKFFRDKANVPAQFDFNFQDENTGENCALIATRKGNLPMVKYLYEICHADFTVFNKRSENAILICAAASKKRSNQNYYDLFTYLIDVIKLDFWYMHEEVILLLEDRAMIKFYENRLNKKGINSAKFAVEKKFEIERPFIPISKEEMMIEAQGDKFQLVKCLEETDDQTRSVLSSIKPEDDGFRTPFMSVLTVDGNSK